MKPPVGKEGKDPLSPSAKGSHEPALPVPQWLIALPVVCALIIAVVIAGSGPSPLTLAIFFGLVFVVVYIYFYMISVWRVRRERIDREHRDCR